MREIQKIKLAELLPPSIASDPDVLAMAEALDGELLKTTEYIPDLAIIHNLRNGSITDSTLIDLLAWGFHVDFYDPDLPIETRAELVARSLDWHTRKGTKSVMEEMLSVFFKAVFTVEEWFEYGGNPYFFRLIVEIPSLTFSQYNELIKIVYELKNVRSWLDSIKIQYNYDRADYSAAATSEFIREYHASEEDIPTFAAVYDAGTRSDWIREYHLEEIPIETAAQGYDAGAVFEAIKEEHHD